jgi:hypothetical protein
LRRYNKVMRCRIVRKKSTMGNFSTYALYTEGKARYHLTVCS